MLWSEKSILKWTKLPFVFFLYLVIKYLQIKRNDKNWIKKMMLKETQELTD